MDYARFKTMRDRHDCEEFFDMALDMAFEMQRATELPLLFCVFQTMEIAKRKCLSLDDQAVIDSVAKAHTYP